jgi:hypothetical protein
MTAEEFKEMFDFAFDAIKHKHSNMPTELVKVELIVGSRMAKTLYEVKEIGFDDKTATIYIEG